MVLEGFARSKFVMQGRHTRSFGGKTWERSEQNLDFIFERDGLAYGIEVKNTLGYMEAQGARGQDRALPVPGAHAAVCRADDAEDMDQ